jgi:vancomycin aglycone glucosyltransferase
MRLLVAAMGSRGDVQPALALACALRAAGHDPVVTAPPDFAAWAAELGLAFVSSGASVQAVVEEHADKMGGNPLRLGAAIRDILVQHVPGMLERALEAGRGAQAIVCAHHFVARTAAEILDVPFVGVMYQPSIVRSADYPPIIARWQRGPRLLNRALWRLYDWGTTRIFMEPINREREKLGLAREDSFERHMFHGSPYLLACDPVLVPAPADWGHLDITTTGPWFYEDATPLSGDVLSFLEAGPPPVYVGFGSMVNEDAAAATRVIVAGAGASGRRVLLSRGWAGLGEGTFPASVIVVDGPMPHAKLFPRVAAVVHHGGAGTTHAALRAGAPQVIVPHLMDQYYYAHRLRVLGIAPEAIPVRKLSADRLGRAIDQAVGLPAGPRMEAADRLREGRGLQRAVDLIEARLGVYSRPSASMRCSPERIPAR